MNPGQEPAGSGLIFQRNVNISMVLGNSFEIGRRRQDGLFRGIRLRNVWSSEFLNESLKVIVSMVVTC
jgi:hypothetical protein